MLCSLSSGSNSPLRILKSISSVESQALINFIKKIKKKEG
jgi:hypothetical protein